MKGLQNQELENKIIQLRKKVFIKPFIVGYEQDKEDALKAEIYELMREEENKQELFKIWTNQFTGNYDG